MSMQKYAVGIDLGTTFSSLAYVDEAGQPQAIRVTDDESALGSTSYSIASAIYFKSSTEVIVGNRALEYAVVESARVATKFKRQMGEPEYMAEVRVPEYHKVPFEVEGKRYRPEELSALVLKRLKEAAEKETGPIREVTISVPYVFDETRRRATQHAGRIAGFEAIDLVDEPVAAGLAYGHSLFQGAAYQDQAVDNPLTDQRILVYDLGGGTFDATIMALDREGVFKVLATEGDWQLGGSDWDEVLLKLICDEFIKQTGADPRTSREAEQELLLKTIEAKKSLSERAQAPVELFHNDAPVTITVKRGDFQRVSRHLLVRTTDTISTMLTKISKEWNYIDQIVVVGGASRMPMVGSHLRLVSQREFDMSLSPDTAIAHGAALYSAMRTNRGPRGPVKEVQTVNSHPLGLLVKEKTTGALFNDVVIPQNQQTDTRVKKRYPVQDPKRGVTLVILEGDLPDPEACVRLGQVRISEPEAGLQLADAPQTVEVCYSFAKNGMLCVEGTVHRGPGMKPVTARIDLKVNNTMSENEVNDATGTLRGVMVE
jgi:molecular chaperone DnaK